MSVYINFSLLLKEQLNLSISLSSKKQSLLVLSLSMPSPNYRSVYVMKPQADLSCICHFVTSNLVVLSSLWIGKVGQRIAKATGIFTKVIDIQQHDSHIMCKIYRKLSPWSLTFAAPFHYMIRASKLG